MKILAAAVFTLSLTAFAGVKPKIIQSRETPFGGPTGTPLTMTLDRAPSPGNMVWAIILYNTYLDYDYVPPDSTWSCTVGGRADTSPGGSVRIVVCSHIVVADEVPRYTFRPNSTDGPGAGGGTVFETANVVSAQVAFIHAGTQSQDLRTPAVVPAVADSLPLAATIGGFPITPSPGWHLLHPGSSVVVSNSLTRDAATPVSTTVHVETNYGNSLHALLLLNPGTFAPAPVATPPPGTFAGPQQITLATPTPSAVIHYTLDGSNPTCDSPAYSSPISLSASASVNTVVCAPGFANSAIVANSYILNAGNLAGISLGPNASLNGYTPFPHDAWHTSIAGKPIDRNSAATMELLRGDHGNIRHDWSSLNGGFGIPYIVVDSTLTPRVPWTSAPDPNYLPQSDVAPYPIPLNTPIEGRPAPCTTNGDNHAIILDRAQGILYEMWRAKFCANDRPQWSANNGAIFDLTRPSPVQRPYTYTSADAGGLSVFEGLVRYDEVQAGVINHAIRFTVKRSGCFYHQGNGYGYFQPPATHAACNAGQPPDAPNLIYYGLRLRLKPDFDLSAFSPTNRIILQAMKTYGLMMADLGNTFDFQGSPDPHWDDADLAALDRVSAANFEVVERDTLQYGALGKYPSGKAPKIRSFTATPSTILAGACATLNLDVSDANFNYIDKLGVLTGTSAKVCPTVTTTYELTATNNFLVNDDGFGDGTRPKKSVTVIVKPIL